MAASKRPIETQSCAFQEEEGCRLAPEYAVCGLMQGPKHLRPIPNAGFIAVAYVCADHVPLALNWLDDVEILPFAEIPADRMHSFFRRSLGFQPKPVQFVA